MENKKYKVAFLTSHVIQYQDPLFKTIGVHPEIDSTVLFCSRKGAKKYRDREMETSLSWDINLLQGYKHKFLKNYSPLKNYEGFFSYINPGLISELKKEKYDAVIIMMGWRCLTAWLGFIFCHIFRTPFFIYGDSSFIKNTIGFKKLLKKIIFKKLFSYTSGFMITGAMNAEYYKNYGVRSRVCFFMPWAIDNERFMKASKKALQQKDNLRKHYRINPEKIVIIFSGKLIKRKNPLHVIQAVERMKRKECIEVVYLGDGAEKKRLEDYIAAKKINGVHFLGFVNQFEVPQVLSISDILLLPSSFDPRGTVVNEAMACGLPIVISNMVGVYGEGDIVKDGYNGFVYNVGDIDMLASILDRLVENDALRKEMGKRSLRIISEWNYKKDVDGILQALRFIENEKR